MYYSAVSILAIFVLFIENQGILFKRGADFTKRNVIAYRRFLFSVLVYYLADVLWGFLEESKLPKLVFFDTSIYFAMMAVSVMCWIGYIVACVDRKYRLRRTLLYIGRLFAAGVIALVIVNFFVPVMFTVDDNSVYKELPARNAILVIQIALLLFVTFYAFYLLVAKRTMEKQKYTTLGLFGAIMSACLIAQLFFPYLPLYATGYLLGLSLLHTYVIVDEKETYKNELAQAKKISALKQSMTTLLDNMPVMSYSKDIETGEYIACNQTFAEYARRETPDGVSGLLDTEIFDAATAEHFTATDKIALEMDKPYIYYEDVKDVDGNQKQFQTTKLKFRDETGKLCLLGMSVDITEMVSAKKENELTKAAYLEALSANAIYENIVSMLSKDYFELYYIDINTDEFVKYSPNTNSGQRAFETRGNKFFDIIKKEAANLIFKEDLDGILATLDKETLISSIKEQGVFVYYYRLIIDGVPNFVCLKATFVDGDSDHIIIGISNVDSQMKGRIEIENAKEERKAYERLSAFSRNLLVLYVVDEESDEYTQFSATDEFEKLGIATKGSNFFAETLKNSIDAIYPDDQDMFHYLFTKEKILEAIELDGVFVLEYRILLDGEPIYVRLKATEIDEDGKKTIVLGLENVDKYVRREQQQAYELSAAREMATKDALTGVRNSYAFAQDKKRVNKHIQENKAAEFAVVICDINGLKDVNDTFGHQAGDDLIRKACTTICDIFRHSKVYRIGGDEFAVFCQGKDYENVNELLSRMDAENRNRDVQIAFGMARYHDEPSVESLIENADRQMYDYKAAIKANSTAVAAEEAAKHNEKYVFPENLRKAYESSPLSFVYYQNIDHSAVPILASEGFCRNVGMSRDIVLKWLKTGMFERMHPDDVGVVAQVSDDFLHQRGPYDVVFRCRLAQPGGSGNGENGEAYVYIHGVGKWQTMPDGTELSVITYSNLSRAQKSTVEKLDMYMMLRKDQFYTDTLTDIPNLNYFNEYGDEKMQTIRAAGKVPSVVYVDIYSMQSYNNQYGLKEGDRLLRLTAQALVKYFTGSLVARSIDDHFIVVTGANPGAELPDILHKVNRIIRKTAFGNTPGIRSGVCTVDESLSVSEALDRAKMALKHIDNNMNREVEFFSQVSGQLYLQDKYIIENLDAAIKSGYIKPYWHSLHRVQTQKIAAFESLARWNDPVRGMIYPDDFIPVLIKYHQLYKLDLYMFEQACRQLKYCVENGIPVVPVSVNFSRQDFDHIDVLGEMNRIYDKYALSDYLDKSYLIIEITEQDLASGVETFRRQLESIRDNRYRLWLDDFGSGYSAISTFSQYVFDLIKIDMELLRHLDDNGGKKRFIVEGIAHLARKLKIQMLAEGLETEEHLAFIRQIDCALAQGYYYHLPEPVDDVLHRISDSGDIIWQCETAQERESFIKEWFD